VILSAKELQPTLVKFSGETARKSTKESKKVTNTFLKRARICLFHVIGLNAKIEAAKLLEQSFTVCLSKL